MHTAFAQAFNKLSIIGHNPVNLIDCSDVIPGSPPLPADAGPHLPAGQTHNDIEQAVSLLGHHRLLLIQISGSALRLRSRRSQLSQDPQLPFPRCKFFPVDETNMLISLKSPVVIWTLYFLGFRIVHCLYLYILCVFQKYQFYRDEN